MKNLEKSWKIESENVKIQKSEIMKIWKSENSKICKIENLKIRKSENLKIENPKIQKSENLKNLKIRKSSDIVRATNLTKLLSWSPGVSFLGYRWIRLGRPT